VPFLITGFADVKVELVKCLSHILQSGTPPPNHLITPPANGVGLALVVFLLFYSIFYCFYFVLLMHV
jgi:hypothetical protein